MENLTIEEYQEAFLSRDAETMVWDYDGQIFSSDGYKHRFVTPELMARAIGDFQRYHHCSREQAIQKALRVFQWCYDDADSKGFLHSYYI